MPPKEKYSKKTDALITEVQQRPAIWNITLEEHGDRVVTKQLWREIVEQLGGKGLGTDEKDELASRLKKKWKNLRDSYFREIRRLNNIRKGYAAPKRNSYLYFERLSFLKIVTETTNPSSCIEHENVDFSSQRERDPLEVQTYRPQHKTKNKERKDDEPIIMEMVNVLETGRSIREPQLHEDNDSDKLFLLSLLDGFRKIPSSCKSAAKIDMIQLVEKYQDPNVFYSHPRSHQTNRFTSIGSRSDLDYSTRPPSVFSDNSNDSIHSKDFKL